MSVVEVCVLSKEVLNGEVSKDLVAKLLLKLLREVARTTAA